METGFTAYKAVKKPAARVQARDTEGGNLLPILRRLGRPRTVARGERLLPNMSTDRDLYLIESGAIKLSLASAQGEELVVGLFFEGDVLGMQQLGDAPDTDVSTAIEHTRVRVLPLALLKEHCRHDPLLQHQLFRLASQRIAQLQQHMLVVARRSAIGRVAGFLVELANRRAAPDGSMRIPLSLYGIGCYLGLSLETVCRALRHIERDGLIHRHGCSVQVLNRDGLVALAGDSGSAATARIHSQPGH